MNDNEFSELFTSKISGAKRGRILASVAAVVLCVALLGGIGAGAAYLINSSADPAENSDNIDPGNTTPGDAATPGGSDTQSPGGDNPSQGGDATAPGSDNPPQGGDATTPGGDNSPQGGDSTTPGSDNPSQSGDTTAPGDGNTPSNGDGTPGNNDGQNPTGENGETTKPLHTHSVRFIWYNGATDEDKGTVYISVLRNDESYSEFELSAANDWYYEWEDEYSSEDFFLMGAFPVGVSAEYTLNGDNFTLIGKPAADSNPNQTGETTQPDGTTPDNSDSEPGSTGSEGDGSDDLPQTGVEWLPVAAMFMIGVVCLVISKRSLVKQ